nr:outer membrane beta-barrel family protein [Haliscomenobacter sp.]
MQRNRITTNIVAKAGLDYNITSNDALTIAGLYSNEHVLDDGDIPYFNEDLSTRRRLWLFHEDEYNTAFTASVVYQHKFKQAGHILNMSFNYTFHREDEKYFLTNRMPTFTGRDTFMLIADESVSDLNVDYVKPLKYGRFESGLKLRRRYIPTNMRFMPGLNSPLDTNAAGWANYGETIPALYGNYVYERRHFELEAGLRVEYVQLRYTVNPDHNTYKSDGYNYIQPFPSVRLSYNLSDHNKLSLFYTRRVDRPDEGDIRIFPKYDEPEILKVGNPALRPQFTNTFELGYRSSWPKGYWYSALYHRMVDGTKVRIGTIVPGSTIIYNIYQNAGNSYNTGLEGVVQQSVNKWFSVSANLNIYRNVIDAFTVENKYPVPSTFSSNKETYTSGSVKLNTSFQLPKRTEIQISSIYLAPDIIPQGEIGARFSVNIGIKKTIQQGKGEFYLNGTDILNSLKIRKTITGNGFSYVTTDYYETQAFRVGYSWKF